MFEVCRFVSQPSEALLLQSPKFALHDWTAHLPPLQVGVSFSVTHAWHAAPPVPVPHSLGDWAACATHPLVSQQPLAHVVELQAVQDPDEQIKPVPHDFPSLMLLPGLHTGPAEHDIVPLLHELPVGVHVALGVQDTQLLLPSQTPLATDAVVQAVPADAAVD